MSESLTPDYFEKIYAANEDPWDFERSEYEAGKYAATLAALPRPRYDSAFEIGCSIGVLTEKLAARCKRLLAVDVSDKALEKARARCRDLPQVEFQKMLIPAEFPAETFDLILLSEVGYYLSSEDWRAATHKVVRHLNAGGNVVLVHWTPFVHDYPQTGDRVHDDFALWTADELRRVSERREEKYRLDVFARR